MPVDSGQKPPERNGTALEKFRTRADLLRFAVAYALRGASKLVRGLRRGLSEDERYRVADDVINQLQKGGWRLSEELPDKTGRGFSTPVAMNSDERNEKQSYHDRHE